MSPPLRRFLAPALVILSLCLPAGAQSVDPLYQDQMERLLYAMGSLYFLQPLCGFDDTDWRDHAGELIDADEPGDDRRQRLTGSFNDGYRAYSRLYRACTASAQRAASEMLAEAEDLSRDIHNRYAE